MNLALLPNFWLFIGPTRLSYTFDWLINTSRGRPGLSSLVPGHRSSSRTLVPRPGPSSLVPDHRPSSQTLVPCPGPSSLVLDPFWHIYSIVRFGRSGLVTYFTLVVPIFIYLSQYHTFTVTGKSASLMHWILFMMYNNNFRN